MKSSIFKIIILFLALCIFSFGAYLGWDYRGHLYPATADDLQLDDQEATIRAINMVRPAVVSIRVMDEITVTIINLDTNESTTKTETQDIGNGTGFLISGDGLILTNRHVVEAADEKTVQFKVVLNTGKEYYAQLIGKDPLKDLAILRIFDKDLPYIQIGDSNSLHIGSTVIAIGNSLGRYRNSATKGIISGVGRYIVTTDTNGQELVLDNVIQIDAEINLGNSGGPLIDLHGQVVGVNVAVDEGGTAIGFAIPMIDAEPVIRTILQEGRILRPKLGVLYQTLTPYIAEKNNLPRRQGAWLNTDGETASAVIPDSPASRAGLMDNDIIFEINTIPLTEEVTLLSVAQRYKPGDRISLKVQRDDKILLIEVELGEFK